MSSRIRRALVLGTLVSGCFPTTRMGDAEVKLADSQLCIGVTNAELDRLGDLKLQAIVVYDGSSAPPTEIWSASPEDIGAPLVLTAGRCVRYGEPPPGYTAKPATPPRLEPDRLYHAVLNASPVEGKRDGTQGYSAAFCLPSSAHGRPVILAPNATSCTGR